MIKYFIYYKLYNQKKYNESQLIIISISIFDNFNY